MLNRFVSFYSNASYGYDNRYTVSGSIRWDKSNLWGTTAKYQNRPLWSVGASWNIGNEDFFHSGLFDMLKLRASYGIGGNIGRNSAPYLVASYFSAYTVDGLAGYVTSPPNADIRWEKTTTINVGTDFSLFKNRLSGSVEYYHKNSVDLLAYINGSATQGFGSSLLTTNNGAMTNSGVELTLNGNIAASNGFKWNASLVYSYNKNKVTTVNYEPTSYTSRFYYPSSYPTEGKALYGIYAYQWAGLNKNGDPQIYDAEGKATSEDVQDNDAIVYCGTTVPVHSATLTNVLSYKNFELSMMLSLNAGHKLRATDIPSINMSNGYIVSTYNSIMDRWQNAGDELTTDVPRLLFSNDEDYNSYRSRIYSYSDLFVYDASNIRIKSVSLAYRIPSNFCRYFSSAKIKFSVENLATFAFDKKAKYTLTQYVLPNYVMSVSLNF